MLDLNEALLLFIDVQGRLHEVMSEKETLDRNLERLLCAAELLELPVLATEQIPEKLGPTNEPFKSMLKGAPIIAKSSFSCCGEPQLTEALEATERKQVILVGIETHVCVYQTAIDLLESGYEVFVAADAVASRVAENKALALEAMRSAGARVLPTESILFALLRDAADPRFKEFLKLIK
ncbi:MAG: isochorismatase family protein [Pontiellaceae bacterium]|nr:isochorismatase family protein [Pontiellaceae bacterium]